MLRIKKNEAILFLYGVFLYFTILSSSTISYISPIIGGLLKYLSLIIIISALFLSFLNKESKIFYLFLLTVFTLVVIEFLFSVNHSVYFAYVLLLTLTLRGINYLEILKTGYIATSWATYSIMFLSKCSIIPNLISYRVVNNTNLNPREALGFTHPNIAAFNLMIIFIIGVFILIIEKNMQIRNKIIYASNCLICVLINLFITDSRTAMFGMIGILIIVIVSTRFSEEKMGSGVLILTIILFLFSVLSMLMDAKSLLFKELNIIFNGRIYSNRMFYLQYGIKFWGNIDITGNNSSLFRGSLILDNAFTRLLVINGLYSTLLYFSIISLTVVRSVKKRNRYILSFVLITMISMFSESQFIVNYGLSFSLILCLSNMKFDTD